VTAMILLWLRLGQSGDGCFTQSNVRPQVLFRVGSGQTYYSTNRRCQAGWWHGGIVLV